MILSEFTQVFDVFSHSNNPKLDAAGYLIWDRKPGVSVQVKRNIIASTAVAPSLLSKVDGTRFFAAPGPRRGRHDRHGRSGTARERASIQSRQAKPEPVRRRKCLPEPVGAAPGPRSRLTSSLRDERGEKVWAVARRARARTLATLHSRRRRRERSAAGRPDSVRSERTVLARTSAACGHRRAASAPRGGADVTRDDGSMTGLMVRPNVFSIYPSDEEAGRTEAAHAGTTDIAAPHVVEVLAYVPDARALPGDISMLLDNCTAIVVLHLLELTVPSRARQRPCIIVVVNKSEMTLMKRHWMQKICRITAWLLAIAIIVLSLVPPSYRPTTDASHSVEHFAIFLGIGFAAGFGYPGRPFVLAAWLMVFCGAIEVTQLWVPGRHARLNDLIVDIAAALIGLSVTFVVMRLSTARQVTGPAAEMAATRHPNT